MRKNGGFYLFGHLMRIWWENPCHLTAEKLLIHFFCRNWLLSPVHKCDYIPGFQLPPLRVKLPFSFFFCGIVWRIRVASVLSAADGGQSALSLENQGRGADGGGSQASAKAVSHIKRAFTQAVTWDLRRNSVCSEVIHTSSPLKNDTFVQSREMWFLFWLPPTGPICLSVTVSSSKPKVEIHEHTGEAVQHTSFVSHKFSFWSFNEQNTHIFNIFIHSSWVNLVICIL